MGKPKACSSWPAILFVLFSLLMFALILAGCLTPRFGQNFDPHYTNCDNGQLDPAKPCSVLTAGSTYYYRRANTPPEGSVFVIFTLVELECRYDQAINVRVDLSGDETCYYDFYGLSRRIACSCANQTFISSRNAAEASMATGVVAACLHLLVSLLLLIYVTFGCCPGKGNGRRLYISAIVFVAIIVILLAASLGTSFTMADEFKKYNNVDIILLSGTNLIIASFVLDIVYLALMIVYFLMGGRDKIYCCTSSETTTTTVVVAAAAPAPAPVETHTHTHTTTYVGQPQPQPVYQQTTYAQPGYAPQPQPGYAPQPQPGYAQPPPQPGYYHQPPPQQYVPQ